MKNNLLYAFLFFLLGNYSCNYTRNELYSFTNNQSIADLYGMPINDSMNYFPRDLFIDTIETSSGFKIQYDTFRVCWYSQVLLKLNEPILYNSYLGKEIYRFTWLRSFDPSIVIRIEKQSDSIVLIEKKLIEYPVKLNESLNFYNIVSDSFRIEESKRIINCNIWNKFQKLLNEKKYQSMSQTNKKHIGLDGSQWILEKHIQDGYYVVDRWSPSLDEFSNFRIICDFLIDNSVHNNEERY